MKEAILAYLRAHGPSYMENIWEAVGEPWPWPQPLKEMQDEGLVGYDPRTARWALAYPFPIQEQEPSSDG